MLKYSTCKEGGSEYQERLASAPVPRNPDRGHPPPQGKELHVQTDVIGMQGPYRIDAFTSVWQASRRFHQIEQTSLRSGMKVIYLTKTAWNCYLDGDARLQCPRGSFYPEIELYNRVSGK
jgi:hypothetical protein